MYQVHTAFHIDFRIFIFQHYEELQGVINKRRSSTLAKEMSKSKSFSDRSRDNQQKHSTKQTPDVVDLCDSDWICNSM